MKLRYKKSYQKSFRKLSKHQKKKVLETLQIFFENPTNKKLKNHSLKGEMKGKRAISAGGDLRIIFREEGGYIEVFMIDVGSHNQVY